MTDVNSVIEVGRLTRDIDSEHDYSISANGNARLSFSIAVNRSVKKGDNWVDEVNYFDVTIWGKSAENLKPMLHKGSKVCVQGYLKQDRWEKDGQKYSRISIVADRIELMSAKENSGDSGNNNYQNSAPAYSQAPQFQPVENTGFVDNSGFNVAENIPF